MHQNAIKKCFENIELHYALELEKPLCVTNMLDDKPNKQNVNLHYSKHAILQQC